MGVTELVDAAIERGETIESMGAGKASQKDLTYYVIELVTEAEQAHFMDNDEPLIKDGVVGAALSRIWDGEGQ